MTPIRIRALPTAELGWEDRADVVVIGAGAAGISVALEAAAWGRDVLLLTKEKIGGGSTPLAQGGLAAVLAAGDSIELHAADTVSAGAGLCDEAAVQTLITAAPAQVARLGVLGARWDPGPLGLEGGHSRHRIVHAGGDASGAEVHRVLAQALATSPVRVMTDTVALDALTDDSGRVVGLVAGRRTERGALDVGAIHAPATVLATGGFGQAFSATTNPPGATGDGLALAIRAGAMVADTEFVQFHPTVMWQAGQRGQRPLVTEALRGAGAVIVDADGRRVMAGVHPAADLAPRDVVAAAMQAAIAGADGVTNLWLDATRVGREQLLTRFPAVSAICRAAGIDPAEEPIPVAPGAHYACGGVLADMDGTTSVAGLFAIGEVSATGVHGANRLASNSLTEAVTTGTALGQRLGHELPGRRSPGHPPAVGAGVSPSSTAAHADAMSRHAGMSRSAASLGQLLDVLDAAAPSVDPGIDLATVEATNLHTVSSLVAFAALNRTESRGCHRREDFAAPDPRWARRQIIVCEKGVLTPLAGIAP